MILNNKIENVKWEISSKGSKQLVFDIFTKGGKYTIKIKSEDVACRLNELKNGLCIRAAFIQEENEINIWKGIKGKYRIECRYRELIYLDIIVCQKEMEKIFQLK